MRFEITPQTRVPVAMLLFVYAMMAGCSGFTGGTKIHQSAKGSVYLQEVVDWSYEASHPVIIDQTTLQKILKGVYADGAPSSSVKMPAAGGKPMRVFSDEDAEFLAPLLAQGLSQAKPEQIIGFTVSSSTGSGAEPTAGTLFIQQGTVHLTLAPSRTVKLGGFMPVSAARLEKASPYEAGGSTNAMSVLVDYQALAKAPMPSPVAFMTKPVPANPIEPEAKLVPKPEAAAIVHVTAANNSSVAETETAALGTEDMLNKKLDELDKSRAANEAKKTEIKMLRKELAWMKRELKERNDELKAMQSKVANRKPAPKKKTAEAQSVR